MLRLRQILSATKCLTKDLTCSLLESSVILAVAPVLGTAQLLLDTSKDVSNFIYYPSRCPEARDEDVKRYMQADVLEGLGCDDKAPEDLLVGVKGSEKRRKPARRMRGHFCAKIATEARLHFGGRVPYTSSNSFAVRKFLANLCAEKGVIPCQAIRCVDEAAIAFFNPRESDLQVMRLANSPALCERRAAYREVARVRGVASELLVRPLALSSWTRLYRRVRGFPDWEAWTPVK